MKTSLRRVAIAVGLSWGMLGVGCTVTGDGVTQAPPEPRPEQDPARIEDPFPSQAPIPNPDPNPPPPPGG